jgi:hypothetical protein
MSRKTASLFELGCLNSVPRRSPIEQTSVDWTIEFIMRGLAYRTNKMYFQSDVMIASKRRLSIDSSHLVLPFTHNGADVLWPLLCVAAVRDGTPDKKNPLSGLIISINPLKKKRNLLCIKTLCVPRSKHFQLRL